jgi:hypothetical protein
MVLADGDLMLHLGLQVGDIRLAHEDDIMVLMVGDIL